MEISTGFFPQNYSPSPQQQLSHLTQRIFFKGSLEWQLTKENAREITLFSKFFVGFYAEQISACCLPCATVCYSLVRFLWSSFSVQFSTWGKAILQIYKSVACEPAGPPSEITMIFPDNFLCHIISLCVSFMIFLLFLLETTKKFGGPAKNKDYLRYSASREEADLIENDMRPFHTPHLLCQKMHVRLHYGLQHKLVYCLKTAQKRQ